MPIKLIVFDHDGTLVSFPHSKQNSSSWGAVFLAAGLKKQRDDAYKFYHGKKELFVEWVMHDVKLLRGIPVERVSEKVFPPHYLGGVKKTVPKIKEMFPGAKLGILSGGVDFVTRKTAEELGFDFQIATELKIKDGHFTGEPGKVIDMWKKEIYLEELLKKENVSPKEACYIGDHDIDIKPFQMCRYSIAVHPDNEEVKKGARVWTNDFREIPRILKSMVFGK